MQEDGHCWTDGIVERHEERERRERRERGEKKERRVERERGGGCLTTC
jgi:hypothetical protein